jgi:exopolysaccharide biosynthesis protein
VAPTEATVCQLAQSVQAVAAINAGYFDPQNQQTTSYVTINRQLVADPASNSRLMENPQLQPYLRQILDRSEFRRYDCSTGVAYAIARHSSDVPSGCTLVDAVGAGPELLPEVKARWEGFIDPEVGRDAIGARQPNARSAVGISATGDVMVVMVAQTAPTGGLTLAQLAELLRSLGAQQALNLDGGTSSALVYEGKAMLGKLDESGQTTSRPVKSILAVTAE